MISNRGPQFVEKLTKELEQYLRFFTEYRQRDWLKWLATAEFVVNNKVHLAMKVSSLWQIMKES